MTRILVVRACGIGDFVLNLPVLRALAARNADAGFTLVGYPLVLELARPFIPVDRIHSIEVSPWRLFFEGPVSGLSFDQAFVWMKDPAYAENIRRGGIAAVFRADPFPESGHAARHLLDTVGLDDPGLPDCWEPSTGEVLVHPGSGSPAKNWPHFEELADSLKDVRFLAGPAEELFQSRHRVDRQKPLAEIVRQLRSCRAFVGNDSGITHLAAYLGCPAIALFGSTDPAVWGPIGRRVSILKKPRIDSISVKEVLEALWERTHRI